jgi:hypothetical protein
MRNMKMQKLSFYCATAVILFFSIFMCRSTFAATHWVSSSGTATWANCTGVAPLTGTATCSLGTANNNAAAGDLVYLRAGTYDAGGGVGIQPQNSGTSSARITFEAYTGETPTITDGSDPFWLSVSYVTLNGITFSGQFASTWGRIDQGASHDEIVNCNFTTNGGGGMEFLVTGAANKKWVTNNWIHGNTFTVTGKANGDGGAGCTDGGGDVMDIGVAYGTYSGNSNDNDNNNTVENNVFDHAPHAELENYGLYTVMRNNVFHNEPWSPGCKSWTNDPVYSALNPNDTAMNGMFGHRNSEFDDDYTRPATYVLIEGNRFGFAGVNQANDGADGLTLAAPQNIVRYNFMFAAMNPGLLLKGKQNGGNGSFGNGGTYNRVYNNTFYQEGWGYAWGLTCGLVTCPWPESAVSLYEAGSGQGNVLKNNIFYLSAGYTTFGSDVMDKGEPSNGWAEVTYTINNWCSGTQKGGNTDASGNTGCSKSGNPMFNNPDLSNPASTTLPDLSLQSTSPAIDGGASLTTTTNAGNNSTSLSVADALYFQDGTWGADISKPPAGMGGTLQADWIAIGTVSNVVQISSVSYGTTTSTAGSITLASPMTWASGAPVWLYKKSDGSVVLAGAAPDYGASEYGTTGQPQPPVSVKTNVQPVTN